MPTRPAMGGRAYTARERAPPRPPAPRTPRQLASCRPAPSRPTRLALRPTRAILISGTVKTAAPLAMTLATAPHRRAAPIRRVGPEQVLPGVVTPPVQPRPTLTLLVVVPDGTQLAFLAPVVPAPATHLLRTRRATKPARLKLLAARPATANVAMEAHQAAPRPGPHPRPFAPAAEAARLPWPVRDATSGPALLPPARLLSTRPKPTPIRRSASGAAPVPSVPETPPLARPSPLAPKRRRSPGAGSLPRGKAIAVPAPVTRTRPPKGTVPSVETSAMRPVRPTGCPSPEAAAPAAVFPIKAREPPVSGVPVRRLRRVITAPVPRRGRGRPQDGRPPAAATVRHARDAAKAPVPDTRAILPVRLTPEPKPAVARPVKARAHTETQVTITAAIKQAGVPSSA